VRLAVFQTRDVSESRRKPALGVHGMRAAAAVRRTTQPPRNKKPPREAPHLRRRAADPADAPSRSSPHCRAVRVRLAADHRCLSGRDLFFSRDRHGAWPDRHRRSPPAGLIRRRRSLSPGSCPRLRVAEPNSAGGGLPARHRRHAVGASHAPAEQARRAGLSRTGVECWCAQRDSGKGGVALFRNRRMRTPQNATRMPIWYPRMPVDPQPKRATDAPPGSA